MPLKRYDKQFGGKSGSAAKAHAAMVSEYGEKAGERVFYATKNKRKSEGKMHSGGTIPKTGMYEMEAGEVVIPAPKDKGNSVKDSCSNCPVMGTSDSSHVTQKTPMDTKKMEMAADKEIAPDIDGPRERETARRRMQSQGHVKPL